MARGTWRGKGRKIGRNRIPGKLLGKQSLLERSYKETGTMVVSMNIPMWKEEHSQVPPLDKEAQAANDC